MMHLYLKHQMAEIILHNANVLIISLTRAVVCSSQAVAAQHTSTETAMTCVSHSFLCAVSVVESTGMQLPETSHAHVSMFGNTHVTSQAVACLCSTTETAHTLNASKLPETLPLCFMMYVQCKHAIELRLSHDCIM